MNFHKDPYLIACINYMQEICQENDEIHTYVNLMKFFEQIQEALKQYIDIKIWNYISVFILKRLIFQ